MTKFNYEEEAVKLSEAIDIAIEAIKKYPPKGFNNAHINQFVTTYLDFKNKALNPEPKFKKFQSLNHIKNDVLIIFQETTGEAVDFFWREIKKKNLDLRRENKLEKILKRQKIKNNQEYDFIIDVLVPYQQEGLINDEQATLLSKLLSEFEDKNNRDY